MPKLFVLTGKDVGRVVELEGEATLGRGADCSVRLRDTSVSRHHARIERAPDAGGGWRIVDTGSRNGVRVDGHKVESAPLADGTVFACGELELRFRTEDTAAVEMPLEPAAPKPRVPEPRVPPIGGDEPDEIVLEGFDDDEGLAETAARPRPELAAPAPRRAAQPAAPAAAGPARRRPSPLARARAAASEPVRQESRVLQYHRIPDREGLFAADLAQQPAWLKLVVVVLVAALFGALAWAAFKGTTFLRQRGQDTSYELPEDEG